MDVIIVSTASEQYRCYWEKRLLSLRGALVSPHALILVVYEDWQGGAGNGLGTLYAYAKARDLALESHQVDIFEMQRQGASVALYHTAGEGRRLYPLVASEGGNKSAIKLPSNWQSGDRFSPMTLLEAVIKQTAILSIQGRSRLSVFWGDQIFIPISPIDEDITQGHVSILVQNISFPEETEWVNKKYDQYGMVGCHKNGQLCLLEKCKWADVLQFFQSPVDQLGKSLGSYSISLVFLAALLKGFSSELQKKKAHADSDTHFWMPGTLSEEEYVYLMSRKGENPIAICRHWLKMQRIKNQVLKNEPRSFFTSMDIGSQSFWWDFGRTDAFYQNLMKMTLDDAEGTAMRDFFGVQKNGNNCFVESNIIKSNLNNCVIFNSFADELEAENSVIINSKLQNAKLADSLLYNVNEDKFVYGDNGYVRSDITWADGSVSTLITQKDRNAKEDWDTRLEGNANSYHEIFDSLTCHRDLSAGINEKMESKIC